MVPLTVGFTLEGMISVLKNTMLKLVSFLSGVMEVLHAQGYFVVYIVFEPARKKISFFCLEGNDAVVFSDPQSNRGIFQVPEIVFGAFIYLQLVLQR
jgi:hypothetical protein